MADPDAETTGEAEYVLAAAMQAHGCEEACQGDVLDCPCVSLAPAAQKDTTGHE
jgi:hypothetical protein